jgi:hypothetical protein
VDAMSTKKRKTTIQLGKSSKTVYSDVSVKEIKAMPLDEQITTVDKMVTEAKKQEGVQGDKSTHNKPVTVKVKKNA